LNEPIPENAPGLPFGRARPLARREVVLSAFAALALALIVLWKPIVLIRTHTLGPWDYPSHASSVLRTRAVEPCENMLVTDPIREMLPWTVFGARELAQGRLPLWNPHNATGQPLFANYQSAFLSPFQAPCYVLSIKLAVLASAIAKLACAAWLAYLFLRTIALSRAASAFGAAVYACAGGQLLASLLPHSGITAVLPGILLCAEQSIAGFESELRGTARRAGSVWLPALALAVGVAALAGHPEMLFANAVVAAAWCAARLIAIARRERGAFARCVLHAGKLVAFAVLGMALAAPQVIAFLEYFAHSEVGRLRTHQAAPGIEPQNWPFQFFPDLAGKPVGDRWIAPYLPAPNYEVCNLFHVGALPLALALTAVAFGALRTSMRVFVLLALLVFLRVGSFNLLGSLVSTGYFPLLQPYALWQISIAVLAAWAIDRLAITVRASRIGWTMGAVVFAAVFVGFALHYIDSHAAEAEIEVSQWRERVGAHLGVFTALFAVGVVGIAFAVWARNASLRAAALVAAIGAHVAGAVLALGTYVPTVEDRFVLPNSPALETLHREVGGERVLFLGPEAPATETNCALGVSLVTSYDGVGLADVTRLASHCFGPQSSESTTQRASRGALDLFGVRFVATRYDWVAIDTALGARMAESSKVTPYLNLAARPAPSRATSQIEVDEQGITQQFVAERDGLSGLVVHVAATPASDSSRIELALRDTQSGREIARHAYRLRDLRGIAAARRECVLRFDPVANSGGASFALEVRCVEGANAHPSVRRMTSAALGGDDEKAGARERDAGDWQLLEKGAPTSGRIVIDLAYGRDFEPHCALGPLELYDVAGARGRAWIVGDAQVASDHEDAWTRVTAESFDARRTVVLESGAHATAATTASDTTLTAISETPIDLRWRANCSQPTFLVVAQPFYPGWRARVGGREVPLHRANYCFCAVELPAGESDVELAYEPRWLWPSVAVALLDLAALAGLLVLAIRKRAAP
jgi:hypothetical protein